MSGIGVGDDTSLEQTAESYLALLAEAPGYKATKKYVDRLVKSMTDFTRDPAALSAVRDEIANQIEAVRSAAARCHEIKSTAQGNCHDAALRAWP